METNRRPGVPILPQVFHGKVTVDGEDAEDGTVVSVFMEGFSPFVHTVETKDGKYGGPGGFDEKLWLSNWPYWDDLIDQEIHFLIMLPLTEAADKIVRVAKETTKYDSDPRELNLSC